MKAFLSLTFLASTFLFEPMERENAPANYNTFRGKKKEGKLETQPCKQFLSDSFHPNTPHPPISCFPRSPPPTYTHSLSHTQYTHSRTQHTHCVVQHRDWTAAWGIP